MAKLSRDVKIDLRFINKDDGEFWMSYDDFKNTFDVIRLCHLQPDSLIQELKDNNRKQAWNVTVYHDAWIKGVTAGGRRNHVHEKFYWINPQFYITLDTVHPTLGHGHGCTLIVSLMKKDKQRRFNIAIDFHVYKLKSPNSWQLDKTTQPESALLVSEGYSVHREVTKRFSLSPGTYIIIPSTVRPGEEGEFILRVFTEKKEDIGVQERVAFIPTKPVVKDQLLDLFNKHAGSDQRMNAGELCTFLEEVSTLELRERLSFSIESCRSLVSFLDEDKSGYLSFNEAKRAWKEIKVYRDVFKQYNRNNSNSVDTLKLGVLLSKLGLSISQSALTSLVQRYGNRDNAITLPDFIMVTCRLTSLFDTFQKQKKKKGVFGDNVNFSRNEFLEVSLFT
ncbi:hypothetical protein Btru_036752 [Bulinus truncatus]|nr:hypothetical protein Btru_036752 [Bulinus truncatus]